MLYMGIHGCLMNRIFHSLKDCRIFLQFRRWRGGAKHVRLFFARPDTGVVWQRDREKGGQLDYCFLLLSGTGSFSSRNTWVMSSHTCQKDSILFSAWRCSRYDG